MRGASERAYLARLLRRRRGRSVILIACLKTLANAKADDELLPSLEAAILPFRKLLLVGDLGCIDDGLRKSRQNNESEWRESANFEKHVGHVRCDDDA